MYMGIKINIELHIGTIEAGFFVSYALWQKFLNLWSDTSLFFLGCEN